MSFALLQTSGEPVLSFLRQSREGLLSVFFPTACPLCRQDLEWSGWRGICGDCRRAIQPWDGATCGTCGIPLAGAMEQSAPIRCGACRRGVYEFDLARSYGVYTDPLRELILRMKFQRRERWGGWLGELLAPLAAALTNAADAAAIVPVPLHPSRQRERGYNQAELLATGLRRRLKRIRASNLPRLEMHALIRARPTPPQSGLHRDPRQRNVYGAFRVSRPDRVRGRKILLVDDVMTTGATVSACARALKLAGADEVIALTLARATPRFPDVHAFPLPVDDAPGART